MKAGFRHPYLLSPQNVSSCPVLGFLPGRFSSVFQRIWISEIPAKAGALQLWRAPSKEVTRLAAKSRENNSSNSTQEAKAGEGKKLHGLCKPEGETQVESLRAGWEGWPPNEGGGWERNGKAALFASSRESFGRRTHGKWGGLCWRGHISTVPPAPSKPENRDAGKGWRCPPQRTVAITLILPGIHWSFGEGHAPKC